MKNRFYQWCDKNLKENKRDIRTYGCDAGFPHITYTSDCVKLYNRFEQEIYEMLNDDVDMFDYSSVDAFVATFRRNDMLWDPDMRKNLLVWYAVEKWAAQ